MKKFPELWEAERLAEHETDKHLERLVEFVKSIASEHRKSGLPVQDDGRIDMSAYKSVYPDAGKDLALAKEWENEWLADDRRDGLKRKGVRDGEKLELLAYAILEKNLAPRFAVVRSSKHDDRVNKVDTIIVDKETGDAICAFDEVGSISGKEYEEKQAAVRERNLKMGGASLKYGLSLGGESGEKRLVPGKASSLPLFYIALPKDRLEKGVKEFAPSREERSDFEKKLFEYFISAISLQIQGLELYNTRMSNELKEKINNFKKLIADLKKKN